MGLDAEYVATLAGSVRRAVTRPVIVTGRINQPQIAERILERGDAEPEPGHSADHDPP